jgi:hypothetical protein
MCTLALLVGSAACNEEDEKREPLPDWRAGYPNSTADAGIPDLPQSFALVLSPELEYVARLGQRNATDNPCSISRDEAPASIDCVADVNELDLWALGFGYEIHVPEGMCDFLYSKPYMFENFEIGVGPTTVSYTVNKNGTYSNEVNASRGAAICDYDYRRFNPSAPNCCLGDYTLNVTNAETGVVSTSKSSWGGKRGDCFYGAAYLESGAVFDPEGVPMPHYIYPHRKEHVERISFDGVSDKFPSNIALANYFEPDDHAGEMPAGLRTQRARPYYEAYCLDDAEEIIAHVRLSVREWNQEVEFDKKGNPDTVGVEPEFSEGPIEIDDLDDWKTETPGDEDFAEIPVLKKGS